MQPLITKVIQRLQINLFQTTPLPNTLSTSDKSVVKYFSKFQPIISCAVVFIIISYCSNITDTKVTELLANDSQADKIKKKRKKKKSKGKGDLDMSAIQMLDNQETETETESTKIVPFDTRTLSNGLTIEDLSSGPPGGRVAVPGKKVCFICWLDQRLVAL